MASPAVVKVRAWRRLGGGRARRRCRPPRAPTRGHLPSAQVAVPSASLGYNNLCALPSGGLAFIHKRQVTTAALAPPLRVWGPRPAALVITPGRLRLRLSTRRGGKRRPTSPGHPGAPGPKGCQPQQRRRRGAARGRAERARGPERVRVPGRRVRPDRGRRRRGPPGDLGNLGSPVAFAGGPHAAARMRPTRSCELRRRTPKPTNVCPC